MKTKNVLVLAALLFITSALMAQDKYEQAVINQGMTLSKGAYVIGISIEGQEYKEIILDKNKKKNFTDNVAVLDEVALMRKDGWEVSNSSESVYGTVYYLRRKLK